jgi:16S rRNA processing protein RimM
MGRIVAPYGVRGWVKIRPYTQSVDGLLEYPRWWVGTEDAWVEHAHVEGRGHGTMLVARLDGFDDREQVVPLRGRDIAIDREELPKAAADEYYWDDLVGLAVATREGVDLGRVTEVFDTGANDVLVVGGERERLIPFLASVLVEVDLAGGRLVVDWDPEF